MLVAPAIAEGETIRPASLAQAEALSHPGDTIVLKRRAKPYDGGIKLKDGQRLIGRGKPVVTNTSERLKGDAVRLADHTVVRGLRIEQARRGAIYGRNIERVTVRGNVVRDHNTGCSAGFQIPPFIVPSLVGGVGIPISDGLSNAWAAIQLDTVRGRTVAFVQRNRILGSDCGDGIDIRASRTARMRVRIARNLFVTCARATPSSRSWPSGSRRATRRGCERPSPATGRPVSATTRTSAPARRVPTPRASSSTRPAARACTRPSSAQHLQHTAGRGGFSANGLEYVSMGSGSTSRVDVRDSEFSGTPGDVIEQLALGTDSRLH